MGNADFNDGDSNAAAMAALHAQTDAERAKERVAAEKKAKRRVVLTAGDVAAIVLALQNGKELAERAGLMKEPRLRTDAINVAANARPLIEQLKRKIPEYVPQLA